MERKKIFYNIIHGILAVAFIVTFSACIQDNRNKTTNSTKITLPPVDNSLVGTLRISGSTSVFPVIDFLQTAYREVRPRVRVNLNQGGSGVGIRDNQDGNNDIGMSSRALKSAETGLTVTKIALDGIAIIINPKNTIQDISKEQLKKIFNGTITNWKEIGGLDSHIILVSREDSSGTREAFEEILGLNKNLQGKVESQVSKTALIVNSTGNMEHEISSKTNAIGYISFGAVIEGKVKVSKIDGIECTVATIKDETYPISRSLYLLVKNGSTNKIVNDFINFVLSDAGQYGVEKTGFIKIN